jgi:hypothetical protein
MGDAIGIPRAQKSGLGGDGVFAVRTPDTIADSGDNPRWPAIPRFFCDALIGNEQLIPAQKEGVGLPSQPPPSELPGKKING